MRPPIAKARRLLDVGLGGGGAAEVRVQRWRCAACGTYFTELPAEACFQAGFARAGARFGVDEKTARAMWGGWAAPRERDLPQRLPEFMGLHAVAVAESERAVVIDVEALAVVDVLAGAGSANVSAWLARIGEAARIHSVAVAVQQPFRAALAACAPGARLMVCPPHAAERGLRAFLSAFRTVRRGFPRRPGSNAREEPRAFARPRGTLSEAEQENMSAWDDAILGLYDAKERFMQALEADRARMPRSSWQTPGGGASPCQGPPCRRS